MAKKKRKVRKKVTKGKSCSSGQGLLWGLLIIALKILGIAFLVQGFVLQLATGILYYGLLHYAIGVVFVYLAHCTKSKCGQMM